MNGVYETRFSNLKGMASNCLGGGGGCLYQGQLVQGSLFGGRWDRGGGEADAGGRGGAVARGGCSEVRTSGAVGTGGGADIMQS